MSAMATTSPVIIDAVHDLLKADPDLATIAEWLKANGLITMKAPGCSIGLEKEDFEDYDREKDEVTAYLSILLWVKNNDAPTGEADVRALAQTARGVLLENRCLGGIAAGTSIPDIRYATADGGKSVLLHIAEIDCRVKYYALRQRPVPPAPIEQVNNDIGE